MALVLTDFRETSGSLSSVSHSNGEWQQKSYIKRTSKIISKDFLHFILILEIFRLKTVGCLPSFEDMQIT